MPRSTPTATAVRLARFVAALALLAGSVATPAAAETGTDEAAAEIDLGYDAGFDFEALGVLSNAWRLGRIYFEESLVAARGLDAAVADFLAAPGPDTLAAARKAWTVARTPYLRTEVFRFIVPQVAKWEGRVNAWPLDEGLIDYTASPLPEGENPLANANLVASPELLIDGRRLDARVLDQGILDALSEAGGGAAAEKNVTTGYHAIEFMLWGQDLNGTARGAGERPWTDFAADPASCTGGHCDRRRAFLALVSERLIADLEEMVALWQPGAEITAAILGGDPHDFVEAIVDGTAEFIQVELAGERMRLALTLHDPEEEHDCFSDQTHRSHYYNLDGVISLFTGAYHPSPGLPADMVASHRAELPGGTHVLDLYADGDAVKETLARAEAALVAMHEAAEDGATFDTLIAEGDTEGNQVVKTAISQLLLFSFGLQELAS